MVVLIRDNECFEPRVQNYINYFETQKIPYHVIAWNRNGAAEKRENFSFFEKRAEYGKRIRNIPPKIAWMSYVFKEIKKLRAECTLLHACDIDAVLPALFAGKKYHKRVVFDIFDWISSLTGKGIIYRMVDSLQNYAYRRCDAVILCEEERKAQAKAQNQRVLILPNIPDKKVKLDEKIYKTICKERKEYDLTVSYVGVFDRDRGLENLLSSVAQSPNILLNIAGFGVLDELVQDYTEKNKNIHCWGRVEYEVGQTIMKNSDVMAAMYHLTSPLHKFAAPNKYYESLLLGVPMITTEGTLVASKVKKFDTGFILDETPTALYTLLNSPDLKEKIEQKSTNCQKTWEKVYASYYESFMREKYLPLMR